MSVARTDHLGRQLPPWEQPEFLAAATYGDQPKRLVVIPGSLNEHRLAMDLVERGNVDRAVVMHGDYVSFEAWRISRDTYAWRSPAMGAPAFMPIIGDDRPDVRGNAALGVGPLRNARQQQQQPTVMTMLAPSRADIEAATRILGTSNPSARMGRDGLGSWTVVSQSTPGQYYTVEQRIDGQHGGTYFFCDCIAWVKMFKSGKDCRHVAGIRRAITL